MLIVPVSIQLPNLVPMLSEILVSPELTKYKIICDPTYTMQRLATAMQRVAVHGASLASTPKPGGAASISCFSLSEWYSAWSPEGCSFSCARVDILKLLLSGDSSQDLSMSCVRFESKQEDRQTVAARSICICPLRRISDSAGITVRTPQILPGVIPTRSSIWQWSSSGNIRRRQRRFYRAGMAN